MRRLWAIFGMIAVLGACNASRESKPEARAVDETLKAEAGFRGEIEPIKGKIDVYNSIARTVKYNVDVMVQNMREKVLNNQQPKETLRGLVNVQNKGENPLYRGMRGLDFAILYAASNLSDDKEFVDDNIYNKASQNLAKAAIKAHQDAMFSIKKIREIDRILSREEKAIRDLNARLERKGVLSNDELALKKGLEVSVYRLYELKKAFAVNVINYGKLAKVQDLDKLELEGKKFYELEDFDEAHNIEAFQYSAYRNRDEIVWARELGTHKKYENTQQEMLKKYPEIERLNINGYNLSSATYLESLEKRSVDIAFSLVEKTTASDKARAFDEMNLAIFAQIELAYNLVHAAEEDLRDVQEVIGEIKRKISEVESKYKLPTDKALSLLEYKIKLIESEAQRSQILGERAMAIRSLYFYAGFSPFTRRFLQLDIKEMVRELKIAFNKDMVEMLAQAPRSEMSGAEIVSVKGNDWAKKENWLEELMENPNAKASKQGAAPKSSKKAKISYEADASSVTVFASERPKGVFDPYVGREFDNKTRMQLGSYQLRKSADIDWERLVKAHPELGAFSPQIEEVRVYGKDFYRMYVTNPAGGFMDLCNKMRRNRDECILR